MFKIEEKSIAYMDLFASPSPLKTPYRELERIIRMDPSDITVPYSKA